MAGRQAGNGRAGKQTGADATAGSNGLGATFVGTLRNARCVVCHGHGRGRRALCRWCGLKVSIYRPSVGSGRAGQGRAGRVRFRYYSTRAHTLLNVCPSPCCLPLPLFPYVTKRNVGRCEPSCIRICNRVIEFGLTVAVRANVGRFDLCPVIARTTRDLIGESM